jgi:regulator of replication initiation timing
MLKRIPPEYNQLNKLSGCDVYSQSNWENQLMLESNFEQSLQATSLIAIAVIAVFIGVQKIIKNWRSTEAETSIISLMHTELERMSEQNTKLSVELGRLHTEVIALNQELQKLTAENQHLRTEVTALTQEVSRFKRLSQEQKGAPNATRKN